MERAQLARAPASKTRDVVNHLQLLGCAHQRGLIDKGNDPPRRGPKVAARGAERHSEIYTSEHILEYARGMGYSLQLLSYS